MKPEERWALLLKASKRVLHSFKAGDNPTFEEIEKLEAAVECVELERICGHRFIDECDCADWEHRTQL